MAKITHVEGSPDFNPPGDRYKDPRWVKFAKIVKTEKIVVRNVEAKSCFRCITSDIILDMSCGSMTTKT